MRKLSMEKEKFGGELDEVVSVCTEIFSQFLLKEYGGPGTLLVEPFTDMLVVLKEKRLAGAAPAARASLLWAQNHLDQDWQLWTSRPTRGFIAESSFIVEGVNSSMDFSSVFSRDF